MWGTGKPIWEHIHTLKEYNKITLAAYDKYCGLVDTPGWKWSKRFTKNPEKFIRMAKIFASQTKIKINK